MTNDEKFERFKEIRKEIATDYRGYALEKIIGLELIVRVYEKRKFSVKGFISYVLKHIVPTYFSTLNLQQLKIHEPGKTLFSMGMHHRKDYREVWEFALKHVQEKVIFDFSVQETKTKINFSNILKAWLVLNKTKKLTLFEKFWLAAKLTQLLNIIDDLEKVKPVAGKYCAFSSIHEHEALLTLYFRKIGTPTYALQHGLYMVYKRDIPLDAILYENMVSDYHLCWGQVTKDEFTAYGIDKNSLIVAGYARDVKRPVVPQQLNKKSCLLLLARYSYHETNIRLFEILSNTFQKGEVNFYLKLHPSLHMAEYFGYYKKVAEENNWNIAAQETTVNELLKEGGFGWSISVNTSAYYEAYIQYLPSLRFNDGTFENMVDVMQDDFSNQNELEERLSQIPFADSGALEDYCKEVDSQLDYAIGINTNKYHHYLNPENSNKTEKDETIVLAS